MKQELRWRFARFWRNPRCNTETVLKTAKKSMVVFPPPKIADYHTNWKKICMVDGELPIQDLYSTEHGK